MTNHLIANLRHLLDTKEISMNELSRRSGLGQTGIADIMSGKSRSPRLDTLEKIAEALDTTVIDLLLDSQRGKAEQDILSAFSQLPEHDQERLLQTAQAWLRKPD